MEQERLESLLKEMSLEEKINQLLQIHDGFFEGDSVATGPAAEQGFSEKEVREAGSVLSATGAARIRMLQEKYIAQHPHHIPLLFMADVINGYKTIFPIPLAQGAAFNENVAKTGAEVAAREASAAGIQITFSPMVDLVRDARWGRVMESNGEDPYLNSVYAKALVEGYQGDDPKAEGKIGACVKHFAAYGAPTAGRDYNNVELSERTLRDDYLPAYEAAVKAGALLVMTSFNTLNRIPSTANQWLMRQVLRKEMGFDGVLISDWAAVEEIAKHNLAQDKKEAAVLALKAGTDIDMMTNCYSGYLKEATLAGEVSEELLDEAVLRVLELKNKLGLFENPYKDADVEKEKQLILCKEHRGKSKEAAKETFVLLENEGMLPLKETERVAFIGPYVEERNIIGFWSIFGEAKDAVNIKEGVMARLGVPAGEAADISKLPVTFDQGCELLTKEEWIPGFNPNEKNGEGGLKLSPEEMLEQAIEHAKNADKVVLCIGEHITQSGEGGSRAEITIPRLQMELLRKVAEVNKNIIVVLFNGRPLDLREVKELSKAILVVWMPGTEGGNAIAEVLYGDVSPSGRLSMSFPYSVGQVPVFYGEFNTGRHMDLNNPDNRFQSRYIDAPNAPLYPFGYGLSYTTFSYSGVSLHVVSGTEETEQVEDISGMRQNGKNVSDHGEAVCIIGSGEKIRVSVKVKNTGNVKGAEVVQMYIRDDKASVVRPVRELKGFRKVWLGPGEEKEVTFDITEDMLRFHNINMDYTAEAGSFTVYIGADSATENQAVFDLYL